MKKILYYILFFPLIVSAQINESDTLNLKAGLSISGLYQGGNVETFIFRSKTDLSIVLAENWVFKNQNSYVYQAFGGIKADEDILSLNFLYLKPKRKIYPFVLSFLSTNFRREIDLRYLTGLGTTFRLINKKNNWLKCSISSEYEQTKYSKVNFNITDYNGDSFIRTLRGTLWISGKYHILEKKIILNHETYFQPSILDINNYRWQANIGLDLPIWKYLKFNINYRYTFESIVIEDQKQQDQFLTFGFTVKNY